MAVFLCRLLYSDGSVKYRLLPEEEFTRALTMRDPILLSYWRLPSWLVGMKDVVASLSVGRVKTEELIDFAKGMSVMLRAGVPLIYALEDYTEMTSNRLLVKALEDVLERVRAGESLSEAIARHPNVFPQVFYRVIRIGEETGNLEGAFKDIADHLTRVHNLKTSIKRALMYPSFVLVATFGALVFWLVFVLPKIVKLFREMHVSLPTITVVVMTFSDFFQENYPYIFGLFVLLVVSVVVAKKKSRRFAYALDWLLLRLPIVRLVINNFQLAFIAEYMRLLILAGANIDVTLELVAQGVGNMVYREAMFRIKEKVVMGESLSGAFREEGIFPRFFVRMIRSGEESGMLDEQLAFAAAAYYDKLQDVTEKMGKMIEPVVLVIVGGLFAVIMVSLFGPVYDLISKISM